jgi:hypothetical protein
LVLILLIIGRKQSQDGSVIATVLELPDCRIEAPTDEQAIAQLRSLVTHRLVNAQVLPLDIPMPVAEETENSWVVFSICGLDLRK